MAPASSTGLVRLEEEAGLPKFSGTSGGSELRPGTSERSGIRSDKGCFCHSFCSISKLSLGSRIYHSSLPIPHSPPTSLALSFNYSPSYCSLFHPRHSFTTARATVIHCFASAHTSSVWTLLFILQAQLKCHLYQEAFLNHPLVPTGHVPSQNKLVHSFNK